MYEACRKEVDVELVVLPISRIQLGAYRIAVVGPLGEPLEFGQLLATDIYSRERGKERECVRV